MYHIMEFNFFIKLFLSFSVGAVWVVVSTTVADHLGTKLGGLVAGLPSGVVVTLLFVGLIQGSDAATLAAGTVPTAFAINGPFLICFCLLANKGLIAALTGALSVWFCLSYLLVRLGAPGLFTGIVIWLVTLLTTYWIFENRLDIQSYSRGPATPTRNQMVFRAGLTGFVVSTGVFLSKLGGPLFGGIAATFPAVFLSTLIISHLSGGADYARGLAKAMMLSGFINVVSYGVGAYFLFPITGIWFGSAFCLMFSLITGYVTLLVMRSSMS